ncbi:MAG: DUF4416 family protein [Desulfobacteraceae bacterium]|nr:DUF4416 family protein [Desulfobacteraceae bacterium]MBC2754554.1 DUF4416 family protein [Desulfobacteraceae bacterium]MBC2763781.1 DUF4416 family protein [ANME-2 cluster archaeon]
MSQPTSPQAAKLVIGVFTNDQQLFYPVFEGLTKLFGDIDLMSPWLPFDYTSYYEREMGPGLLRRMAAFKMLIDQTSLSAIKLKTNAIEREFSKDQKRSVNIDPGYMLRERFVLATGKNFAHRIYIGDHIYADLTLIFQKGSFQPLPWTYPDYKAPDMHSFLYQVRNKYIKDITETEF